MCEKRMNRFIYLKSYNKYELRFLQVLIDKKTYESIKNLHEVKGMKKKKVFIEDNKRLSFESE